MKLLIVLFFYSISYNESHGQYCSKSLPDGADVIVDRFRLEAIDQSSGYDMYADNTNLVANVERGVSYTAIVNGTGGSQNGRIFIDWNQDFDFDDADETIVFTSSTPETSVNIDIPADALLGSTRLRLVLAWNGNPPGPSACNPSGIAGFRRGDVEDYTIEVGVALPIELINFDVTLNVQDERSVKLNWKTASEQNNDYFTIERSTDSESWIEVKQIDGAGNSLEILEYQAYDFNLSYGTTYYRLKQTDFDGQYSYSEIKRINIEAFTKEHVHLFPNPVHSIINITFDSDITLQEAILYSHNGRNYPIKLKDVNSDKIDMSYIPGGVYTLMIVTSSGEAIKKLVVN